MKTKYFFLIVFLLFAAGIPANAQKQNRKTVLTGYVTDNAGNPVQGAMILVDKKNTNIVTDDKGFYRIKVKADSRVLTIFTLASGTGEVEIAGRPTVNVRLSGIVQNPSPSEAKDEKVSIGYGSTANKNVTTQINKVDASDKYSKYSTIYDMLRGAVPGVQVIGNSVTIQGASSGNANSEPLIVVDGNIVQSVDDILPSEVKSVEVLKGASATIYGARGQNGVLMIRLKGSADRK
jgi:TonB-dependent starch-binding outer membrane protein SusC